MNRTQLIDALAEKADMTRAAAARAVAGIFGSFVRRERAARTGHDPRTGAVIHVPPRTTVAFVPGKKLRKKLEAVPEGRRADR
jgi:DNA-binding protein HU-beta